MHAATAITDAAARHGWIRVDYPRHDNVYGRGQARLFIGFSRTGKAVEVAQFYPIGCGTGYIDDPTPYRSVGGRDRDKLETVLGWLAAAPSTETLPDTLLVIACAAHKLDRSAPAHQLYDSDHFRLALRAAQHRADALGARVMILSAKHGLTRLDRILMPYDVTMGQPGAIDITPLATHLWVQRVRTVEALLPKRYLAVLRQAAEVLFDTRGVRVEIVDLYAGARGIGDQRAVLSRMLRTP
ncbi:DUF6884 domain-containing protein [Mycobacterium hubeiense]|uniref:DUF6884 domain-containing protein n=1 Tax=Mycobacterium hubeiense TaxID=1867256 RepID=UPI000C7F0B92|nr:DUF6884 domain-containing protein [Mycobacterium sp. QGD 101]